MPSAVARETHRAMRQGPGRLANKLMFHAMLASFVCNFMCAVFFGGDCGRDATVIDFSVVPRTCALIPTSLLLETAFPASGLLILH